MSEERKAIVTVGTPSGGLIPTDLDSLWRLSTIMASSGLMPKGIEKPESVFVAVQMGLEIGLSPMQSVQNIAVVNGRPCVWGDAVIGLVEGSGLLEEFEEFYEGDPKTDEFKAVCIAKRRGRKKPIRNEFSMGDAKEAGLFSKDIWKKYPKRMLKMRARGFTLRDGFADVLKGLKSAEEVMDYDIDMQMASPGKYEPIVVRSEQALSPSDPIGSVVAEPPSSSIPEQFWTLVEATGRKREDKAFLDYLNETSSFYGKSLEEVMGSYIGNTESLQKFLNAFDKRQESLKSTQQPAQPEEKKPSTTNMIHCPEDSGVKMAGKHVADKYCKTSCKRFESCPEWHKDSPEPTLPCPNRDGNVVPVSECANCAANDCPEIAEYNESLKD